MAVKIKLQRLGQIRQPHYRVIVADARTRRSGRAIENIGKYHPKQEPSFIEIDSERVQHWLSVGAQPTEPVQRLLEITGDWQKFKGLPGAEGTLKVAAPKTSKQELFEAALAAAGDQPVTEATTPKKRSSKKAADKPAADKPADGDAKADAKPAAKAAGKEAKAEAKADTKTEAKADEATDKAASEGA